MLALLAQTASAAEWHDGWQLIVTTFTAGIGVVAVIIGWLHKQTKTDLADVKDDLSVRITDVKTELKGAIVSAERRLKAEITRVEGDITELKDDIGDLRTDLKADIARAEDKLSADIGEVRGDLVHLKDNLLVDALKRARNPAAATQLSKASLQQPPLQPKQLAETSTPY